DSAVCFLFFFSSRRRHTRFSRDWSSDVCSSDLGEEADVDLVLAKRVHHHPHVRCGPRDARALQHRLAAGDRDGGEDGDDAQHGEHLHHGEASPHRAASRAIRAAAEPPRGTTAALNPLKPAPLAMTNLLPAGAAAKKNAQSGRELAATQAGLPEKSGEKICTEASPAVRARFPSSTSTQSEPRF